MLIRGLKQDRSGSEGQLGLGLGQASPKQGQVIGSLVLEDAHPYWIITSRTGQSLYLGLGLGLQGSLSKLYNQWIKEETAHVKEITRTTD